jgi:hypothetical protein
MKMDARPLEEILCENYVNQSISEIAFEKWIEGATGIFSLIAIQGFEERSIGLLRAFADRKIKLPNIVIVRYNTEEDNTSNSKYTSQFNLLAQCVTDTCNIVTIDSEGTWLKKAFDCISTEQVLIDITGLSRTLLFGLLDYATNSGRNILIGYSEAKEYWPKYKDWMELREQNKSQDSDVLAEVIDSMPWLFSHENKVQLISGHEGYDAAGCNRILIGFLTFKCARLAAILKDAEYSKYCFIVGEPRLKENEWRTQALLEINSPIVDLGSVVQLKTYGYRDTITQMSSLLFQRQLLMDKFNVSIAPLGSKLQTIGCWVVSRICKSITFVTSIPSRFYEEAFSDGIGQSWVFPLTKPPL